MQRHNQIMGILSRTGNPMADNMRPVRSFAVWDKIHDNTVDKPKSR